jgi:hypothetical protein
MIPITFDGNPVYGVLASDGLGVRVRVSIDEREQLGLVPGRQVRVEAPGHAGTYLLTAADEAPPVVWLRLLPLASRIAS